MTTRPLLPLTIIIFCCLYSVISNAQLPGIKWMRMMGGTNDESFTQNAIARDGAILQVGRTNSVNGDFPASQGLEDMLITLMNPDGSFRWKKVVGGSYSDGQGNGGVGADVDTTIDGNFVVGMTSGSINGAGTGNHGSWDVVFQKYTMSGTLLWTKVLGGTGDDRLYDIKATLDGGFIAMCGSLSNNTGNVPANHGNGTEDIWVIKFDASANIQWQKMYGGSADDSGGEIALAPDGGYFLAGTTKSNDGDLSGLVPNGTLIGTDVWLFKINNTGTIQWSRQIGGTDEENSPHIYSSGTAVYVSLSFRSTNRDFTVNLGSYDDAIFKYSNYGNFLWKNTYGGFSWDNQVSLTGNSSGLIMAVGSYSTIYAGNSITNYGNSVILLSKLDTLNGAVKWLRTIGGSNIDFPSCVKINAQGNYIISGQSNSNDFDITGNKGSYDALTIIALQKNTINGTVYIDTNSNGSIDAATDKKAEYVIIEALKNGNVVNETLSRNGSYELEIDTGNYVVMPRLWNSTYYTVLPISFTQNFSSYYQSYSKDILLKPVVGKNDLKINMTPLDPGRPGADLDYEIVGYNAGTTIISNGTISLNKDSRTIFKQFSQAPSSVSGNDATWNFSNLNPFDSVRIIAKLQAAVPPFLSIGDYMRYEVKINPIAGDNTPVNNDLIFYHAVVTSFDPNDKEDLNGNKLSVSQVQGGENINYVIHFQNVGNASAVDVVIKDTLCSNLKRNTLEISTASHPFSYNLKDSVVTFAFKGINLPDSNSNESGSHGYISFSIKPITTLLNGDSIVNKAAIYFDFNEAVITNSDVIHISTWALPIKGVLIFTAAAIDGRVELSWETTTDAPRQNFVLERSVDGRSFSTIATIDYLFSGHYKNIDEDGRVGVRYYYRLKQLSSDGSYSYSNIVSAKIGEVFGLLKTIPNPAYNKVTIICSKKIRGDILLCRLDGSVVKKLIGREVSSNGYSIDISELSAGTYIIKFLNNELIEIGLIEVLR